MDSRLTLDEMFAGEQPRQWPLSPAIVERYMPTCAELARILDDIKARRGMSDEQVAQQASVPIEEVRRFCSEGKGDLDALFKVLDALRIKPVAIPSLDELGG